VSLQKCLRRSMRLFTLLAALCYLWVGSALSFQHTDCLTHDVETLLRLPSAFTSIDRPFPLHTRITHTKAKAHPAHCDACEWQANNVSPALPAFTFTVVTIASTRVVTTFPRYLRTLKLSTSSRAPPLA
jgi:hypothetical protein